MADDLPPGYTLDPPAAGGSDLPPGYKLDATPEEQSRTRIEGIKARLDKARTEAASRITAGGGGGEPGYRDIASDSFTGSLFRPVGGAISAAVGGLSGSDPGSSFTERYKASVENENERMARAEKEKGLPGTLVGAAASLPLAVATGGGAAVTIPKLIGQGAAMGAASGAARHAESTDTAAKGAVEGGLEGGAAGVLGTAAKMLPGARRVAATEKQIARGATPEEGKAAAKEFYKEMDKGGIAYAKPQTAMVKKGLDDLVATNQYDPIAHQKISGLFSKLDQAVTQPQGATLTELHNLRSALAKEARGADASTREAAGKVVGTIDDLVHGSRPATNPNNLDVKSKHAEASQKWRSAALADDIEWREGKAATKLAVSPGTSADTANRAAFKPVLDRANKPGAYNPYTDEQKALLAKIVSGDRGQNALRNVGRAADSPITRGIGAGVGGVLGFGHGGPFAAGGAASIANKALHGVGWAADALAARQGQKNIDALLRNISGPSSATRSRSDLAQILAAQTAARTAATQGDPMMNYLRGK